MHVLGVSNGRLLVLRQTFARRMEAQSRGSSDDLAVIWQRRGGSICLSDLDPLLLWFSWTEKSSPLGQDALVHNLPDVLLYAFPRSH